MVEKYKLRISCFATLIAFCFIVTVQNVYAQNVYAQNIKLTERLDEQNKEIAVSSAVSETNYCSNGNIRLKISVTVENSGEKNLVFCRECMTDMGIFISRSEELLRQNKFIYDLSSFGSGRKLNLLNPLPSEKPFVTIRPGDQFEFSVKPLLVGYESKVALKNDDYSFVLFIDTWSDYTDLGKKLKNQWSKDNIFFWTDTIVTQPAPIKISNNIVTCKS